MSPRTDLDVELGALVDAPPFVVLWIAADGAVERASAHLAALLGKPPEAVVGAEVGAVIEGATIDWARRIVVDGHGRSFLAVAAAPVVVRWQSAAGRANGGVVLVGLVESSADAYLHEAVEEVAKLGSFDVDPHTGRAVWSRGMYRIFGVDPSQTEGLTEAFASRVHPEANIDTTIAGELARSAGAFDRTGRLLMPDGQVKWVRIRGRPIDVNSTVRLVGLVEDISDRVVAEQAMKNVREELRVERKLLRALIDAFPGYVGLYDAGGGLVDANQHSLERSDRKRDVQQGLPMWDIPILTEAPALRRRIRESMARAGRGERVRFDALAPTVQGPIELDITFAPIHDEEGKVSHIATYGVDISTRNEAIRRLVDGERRLRHAQQIASLGNWEMDHTTRALSWSDEVFRILEIDPGQTPRFRAFMERVHPDERERVLAELTSAVDHVEPARIVCRLLLDGRVKWVQMFFEASRDPSGRIAQSFGTVQDITERVLAEQREDDLRAHAFVLGSIGESVIFADGGGMIRFTNAAVEAMFGYEPGELHGRHVSVLDDQPLDEAVSARATIQEAVASSGVFVGQVRNRKKDGTVFYTHTRVVPLELRGERLFVSILDDVSERVRADQEVRRTRDLLRTVLDSTPDWVFAKDLEYRFILVNRAFAARHGVTPDAMIGRPDTDYFRPEDCEGDPVTGQRGIHDDDRDAFAGKAVRRNDVRVVLADGVERTFDTYKGPLVDETGRVYGVLGYTREITEQRRAAKMLERALAEKETLLREIHHRVKNNLQIISGLLHFQAKKVRLEEDVAAFADGRKRLLAMMLVHDKLYQSKELARVELGEYVRTLAAALARSFDGARIRLDVASDAVHVPADFALTVGMILCELVTNVFKYAYPVGAEGVGRVALRAADRTVSLVVEDQGRGFPPDFDPRSATSFGWHLVRNLVDQLDGTISASSDHGVRVRATFPYQRLEAAAPARAEQSVPA